VKKCRGFDSCPKRGWMLTVTQLKNKNLVISPIKRAYLNKEDIHTDEEIKKKLE